MRIGVDLHVLQGINQGSKTYLDNLYTRIGLLNKAQHDFFFYFHDVANVPEKWKELGQVRGFGTTGRFSRLIYDAAIRQKKDGLHAFHSQYICPLMSLCDDFVTIHDILFETHPQFFSKAFVARSRLLVKRSALKARHVFTVSEYSRQKLIECYGIPESQVTITPNGVNREEFAIDKDLSVEFVKAKYGISDYILSVGRLEPRKNHVSLLKAYARLKQRHSNLQPLVFVGQRDFGFTGIFETIQEHGLEKEVKIIEDAGFSDLTRLYRAALCFVYPSFAEGFGIPPLEAMAAGCPVVCSNTTAMADIYSETAEMIDPYDVDSLSDAILRVLDDSDLRQKMQKRNEKLVDRFTWLNSSKNLIKAYDAYY